MLRGTIPARIDDKGRLKIPNSFRTLIEERYGPLVYVTSYPTPSCQKGDFVRIYPIPVWEELEAKLTQMSTAKPTRRKFLDYTGYYGQTAEMDTQGRILIHPRLREAAAMLGEVDVTGHLQFLDVWNQQRRDERLEPWTDDDDNQLAAFQI